MRSMSGSRISIPSQELARLFVDLFYRDFCDSALRDQKAPDTANASTTLIQIYDRFRVRLLFLLARTRLPV
jgi:hypothetical protein